MTAAVDAARFRDALSRFASGVTVVTVGTEEVLHGMTASAFASVSLEPPRVLVCLDKASTTNAMLKTIGSFAVNVLSSGQEETARAFAASGRKPFDRLPHRRGATGAPLLDDAIATIECRVVDRIEGGDHDIILGEVVDCEARAGQPLLYFDRGYRSLSEG